MRFFYYPQRFPHQNSFFFRLIMSQLSIYNASKYLRISKPTNRATNNTKASMVSNVMCNHRWTSPIYPQKCPSFMFYTWMKLPYMSRRVTTDTWPNRHEFPKNDNQPRKINIQWSTHWLSLTLFLTMKRALRLHKILTRSILHRSSLFLSLPFVCFDTACTQLRCSHASFMNYLNGKVVNLKRS